jgi:alkylated DNA repair dioxygenase AlkB
MKPKPYPEFISRIQAKIETITTSPFNSVLLNRYNDGSDKVAWHSDDERELSDTVNVASVSFGAARDFQLRKKPNTKTDLKILLEHGSLLLMKDPLQSFWEHQIPTRSNSNQRINLTFRNIIL